MAERADIAIVGGGPVGCVLALALHAAGRGAVLLEQRARDADDTGFRPIALSYASRLILERVGVWSQLAATAITGIHVSQAQGPGIAELAAADARLPALGYVVEYGILRRTLLRLAAQVGIVAHYDAPVTSIAPGAGEVTLEFSEPETRGPLVARCTVHADGAPGAMREHSYGTNALVARVGVEPVSSAIAYERFTSDGPLALLPLAGSYGLVWSLPPGRAAHLAQCLPGEFLAALEHTAPAHAGRFVSVDARTVHPLALRERFSRIGAREVFIGNAAQTLHPVAGQGLNLGLRDAWDLADACCGAADPGDPQVLRRYAATRRIDASATTRVTDILARAFTGADPAFAALRGVALTGFNLLPCTRRFFARRMIFGAYALP